MNLVVHDKRKQIGIILSASLAGFMTLLDSNIINISLPVIASYFDVSTSQVIQVTLIYLLMLTSSLIIFGKLADNYGVRRIFVTGFTVFTASSFLCGIAPGFYWLLLARLFQALGGSMLFATSISLITRFIPAERRGWAFGIFSPLTSLGMLVGNPLGGLITGMLNWHWIFLVNIPVGVLAIIAALRAIPKDIPKKNTSRTRIRFDLIGSVLSFSGLGILVFFTSRGNVFGWTSLITLMGLSGAVLLLVLFVLWERKSKDPILDLTIFSNRSFSFAILASVAGFGLMSGTGVMLPFYLTYGLHISVEHAGFILMTFPVIFSLTSPVTGSLSDRVSKVWLTLIGMILATVSCVVFSWLLPLAHLGILFAFMVFLGLSYALFITPNNNLVMSMASEDKQSVSSSVFKLATNLGQMIGLILMEMVFSSTLSHPATGRDFVLNTVPVKDLMSGFSLAYLAGGALCLLAVLFSVFIREKDTRVIPSEEISFPG